MVFYFSGHQETDSEGDLKDLAVIIDACNSGGFEDILGNSQLIIASSNEN